MSRLERGYIDILEAPGGCPPHPHPLLFQAPIMPYNQRIRKEAYLIAFGVIVEIRGIVGHLKGYHS